MFERDYIKVTRSFFEDSLYIRHADILVISGTVGGQDKNNPEVIEGSCTLYLKGELGFAVNHTAEEVISMITEKQVTQ